MEAELRDLVCRRAGGRCEYCLLPQEAALLTFHVDHIVALQHRGKTDPGNLALSCNWCNLTKGPNLSSIDPVTDEHVALFHPRKDVWSDHFEIHAGEVVGVSAMGRATVELLVMNEATRVELREEWLQEDGL